MFQIVDLNSYYYTEWDNSQFSDLFYDFDNQDFQVQLKIYSFTKLNKSKKK